MYKAWGMEGGAFMKVRVSILSPSLSLLGVTSAKDV